MEESIQNEGNHNHRILRVHSTEELESLKKAHPYSAHIHWELVRHKLVSGELTNQDLEEASLHMKDAKAFFREVERLRLESISGGFSEKIHLKDSIVKPESQQTERKEDKPQFSSLHSEQAVDEVLAENKGEETSAFDVSDEKIETQDSVRDSEAKEQIASGDISEKPSPDSKDNSAEEYPDSRDEENRELGAAPVENFQHLEEYRLKPSRVLLSDQKGKALSGFTSWLKSLDQKSPGIAKGHQAEKIAETDFSGDKTGPESSSLKKVDKREGEKKAKKKHGKKKTIKDKKKPKPAQDLELRPDVISETLADLLSAQGHIDEANEMYKRLGLKYPEKSSYFASKFKNS